MDHALAHGQFERAGTLEYYFDHARQGQEIAHVGVGVQRAAGNVLHDHIGKLVLAGGVVDLDDVRMGQAAHQAGFRDERLAAHRAPALLRFRVIGEIEDLDRHLAPGETVTAQVDARGRATPDFADDVVLAYAFQNRSHGL